MTPLSILIAARDWLAVGPERWCRQPRVMEIVWLRLGERTPVPGAMSSVIDALYDATGRVGILTWQISLPPGRAGWKRVIEAFDCAIEAEKARSGG